jgi:hypothetical protein
MYNAGVVVVNSKVVGLAPEIVFAVSEELLDCILFLTCSFILEKS